MEGIHIGITQDIEMVLETLEGDVHKVVEVAKVKSCKGVLVSNEASLHGGSMDEGMDVKEKEDDLGE